MNVRAILVIGFLILMLAIGGGVVYTYNSSIKRAEKAEKALQEATTALDSTKQALDTMSKKVKELDNLLLTRQENERKARKEAQDFEDRFNLLREKQGHVNVWANTVIPINPATGELRK